MPEESSEVERPDGDAEPATREAAALESFVAQEGEYYFDGPYMVFTEDYHLRRGYCCRSGCRHCPYGFVRPDEPAKD
jgi:hypothetical protein